MLHLKQDVEAAVIPGDASDSSDEKLSYGVPLEKAEAPKVQPAGGISHYALAKQMINYQSIDVGNHCKALGAD